MTDLSSERSTDTQPAGTVANGTEPRSKSGRSSLTQLTPAELYEIDFIAWCENQAGALKTRNFDQLDLVNLIEEISDMGR